MVAMTEDCIGSSKGITTLTTVDAIRFMGRVFEVSFDMQIEKINREKGSFTTGM